VRALLVLSLVLLGCYRPAWHLRSPDGIPRDATIWVVPASGPHALANEGFDDHFLSMVVHDGATVRQDAAWVVSVRIVEAELCRAGWLPNHSATARAIVTIRRDVKVTDVVEITAAERCVGGSRRALSRALARRAADIVAWRRHAW